MDSCLETPTKPIKWHWVQLWVHFICLQSLVNILSSHTFLRGVFGSLITLSYKTVHTRHSWPFECFLQPNRTQQNRLPVNYPVVALGRGLRASSPGRNLHSTGTARNPKDFLMIFLFFTLNVTFIKNKKVIEIIKNKI